MPEIPGRPRLDPLATARTECLPGVDEPFYAGAFLLMFPAIAVQSGATFGHMPKSLP